MWSWMSPYRETHGRKTRPCCFRAAEAGLVDGFIASHAVTTIYYIVAKQRGRQTARAAVRDLLGMFRVVPAEDADFQQALSLEMNDFEDAVQAAAALRVGADYLVTRNERDFRGIPLNIRTPGAILALL